MNRVVFLDRDGTLNVEVEGFLTRPDQLRLVPGAGEAVARLNRAGFKVALITNQSAIGRGLLDEAGLERIHLELSRQLADHGARLDSIDYCPHHPDACVAGYRVLCDCRKPSPGLLHRAARRFDADLERSHLIGDDSRDVELALAAPVTPWLVRTGKGARAESEAQARLGSRLRIVEDLKEAVDEILRETS